MKFITIELFIYLYLIIDPCLCKRQNMLNNSNTNLFGILFYLLDRKLIFRSKTIWQSMRKFSICSLKRGDISSYGQKRNVILSGKLHADKV